jgi:hypothetical protein
MFMPLRQEHRLPVSYQDFADKIFEMKILPRRIAASPTF